MDTYLISCCLPQHKHSIFKDTAFFEDPDIFSKYLGAFSDNGPFSAEKRDEQSGCPFCRSTVDILVHTKEQQRRREECLLSRANNSDSRAFLELALTHQVGRSLNAFEKLGCDEDDMLLTKGQPIPDQVTAVKYFETSAALGNGDSYYYYELSKLHRTNYNASDFLSCLEKATNLGNFNARTEYFGHRNDTISF